MSYFMPVVLFSTEGAEYAGMGLLFIRRVHRLTQIDAGFFGGMSCRCASSHAAGVAFFYPQIPQINADWCWFHWRHALPLRVKPRRRQERAKKMAAFG
ncbi:MAG: hypothetical protein PHT80_11080, partial [Lentisphaeria bacterium]|nr:hypothetical protein [Lentisphaeria bacterium]